jgi:Na+-transporting methylmalonyl-CoA/oxaloacetate decarboxylase gamma subunit
MDFSFQNVIDADGIGIAITGMAIVFSGLVLISLYISSMPKLLSRMEKAVAKKQARKAAKKAKVEAAAAPAIPLTELSDEMMAAVAFVIRAEAEYEDAEDHQRITVQHDDANTVWAVTGRLRNLSTRM